jgi:hypothetical protein
LQLAQIQSRPVPDAVSHEQHLTGLFPNRLLTIMSGISNISGEDLKAQLSEYHLIVAEVIGGLSADLIETKTKVTQLESRVGELTLAIEELKATARLLVQASLPRE